VKTRAFTLLETLLALMIFSIAVVALVEAVNQLGKDTLHRRREATVHERVRSLLVEHSRLPNAPEEAKTEEDGVSYLIRRKRLDLKNREGMPINDLFEVRVTAEWLEGREPQTLSAETWVYPPLFRR
jgi:prepilin-type N-terminal cleavage/methylation domain-containing protein